MTVPLIYPETPLSLMGEGTGRVGTQVETGMEAEREVVEREAGGMIWCLGEQQWRLPEMPRGWKRLKSRPQSVCRASRAPYSQEYASSFPQGSYR